MSEDGCGGEGMLEGIERATTLLREIPRSIFLDQPVSCTKHVWYSEHGTYHQFEIILERAMSATHVAVILRTRTGPAYTEESMKTDYPDVRNEYSTL